MSTATLPPRIVTTSNTTSDMQCEACSSSMTISPNPYFGTGLAVHRHIAECETCGAVAFVPEPEPVPSLMERIVGVLRAMFSRPASV